MNWPRRIYVATKNLGVYYTDNFTTYEKQPTWYPINAGLPSLDIVEFHVDMRPREETDDKDILYALLSNHATIYRKVGTDPWKLYATSYCIHGFEAIPGGGIWTTTGARGVVDPVEQHYHGPNRCPDTVGTTDKWAICECLNGDCSMCHEACRDYCDDDGDTIWTYGCGSPRKGYWTFAWGMGAIGYINIPVNAGGCVYCGSLHQMFCCANCCPCPCPPGEHNPACHVACPSSCGLCTCPHPHLSYLCTGTGNWTAPLITTPYTDKIYTVHHPNLSGFFLADVNGTQEAPLNGMGSDSGYDSLWANPDDTDHMRLVSGGVINETFDGQWETGVVSGDVHGITSLADWAGEDPDNIIAGSGHGANIIGVLYGMDDTHFKSIAGATRNIPPYTGSIPAVATGGIALGGIYPVPETPGGIRIYAVAMPYYKGNQRGEPMDGDRAAWDVTKYPDKHAKDLNDGEPIRHAPLPTGVGDIIYSTSGSTWDTYRLASLAGFGYRETIFTFNGELSKKIGPFRIYNKLGVNQEVSKVVLSVAGPPQGNEVIVDIRKLLSSFDTQGISVWSPNNGQPGWEDVRPTISSGSYYGETSDDPSPRGVLPSFIWGEGRALRAEVAQAGSTYGGSYLVVHLIHRDTAENEPGFESSISKPAMLVGESGIYKRAMIVGEPGIIKQAYVMGGVKSGKPAHTAGISTLSSYKEVFVDGE